MYIYFYRSLGDEGAGDTHNETTVSEASGDITLDSVKDHMVSQSVEINSIETPSGSRTERIETISRTMESVSIVHSQQFVVPAAPAAPAAVAVESSAADNGSTSPTAEPSTD